MRRSNPNDVSINSETDICTKCIDTPGSNQFEKDNTLERGRATSTTKTSGSRGYRHIGNDKFTHLNWHNRRYESEPRGKETLSPNWRNSRKPVYILFRLTIDFVKHIHRSPRRRRGSGLGADPSPKVTTIGRSESLGQTMFA